MTNEKFTLIEAMTLKTKYITSNFKPWKVKVLTKMKKKNKKKTELKQKIQPKQTEPVLNETNVKKHLQ